MSNDIPIANWVRFGANVLSIWIFILCYILVLKRRSESLLASKMRTLVHIYYIFSILSQVLFTRNSIIGYFMNKWLKDKEVASLLWIRISLSLYTATNRIIPSLMVTIVIVGALDALRNTTVCQRGMGVTTAVYTPLVALVSIGTIFCNNLCIDKPEVQRIILYTQEILTALPYLISIIMILMLFRKSQEAAETDIAIALIEDNQIENSIMDMNHRKGLLLTILILRSAAMLILLCWNMVWISLFFNTTEPGWVPYVEACLLVIYETLNSTVFVQRGK